MRSPLLTFTHCFNLSAIMTRAWRLARHEVKVAASVKLDVTLRDAFRASLRQVWSEARDALSYVRWAAEQDRAAEASKTLDARTREIVELRFARAAADGIDSTRTFLETVRAIDGRLAELGAR